MLVVPGSELVATVIPPGAKGSLAAAGPSLWKEKEQFSQNPSKYFKSNANKTLYY